MYSSIIYLNIQNPFSYKFSSHLVSRFAGSQLVGLFLQDIHTIGKWESSDPVFAISKSFNFLTTRNHKLRIKKSLNFRGESQKLSESNKSQTFLKPHQLVTERETVVLALTVFRLNTSKTQSIGR